MEQLTLILIILFLVITLSPLLAKITKIPLIVVELIIGIILGKSLFNIIPSHPLFDFFSSFGLIYLMFLAGLEVSFEEIKKSFSKTILIAVFSISVPFLTGVFLSYYIDVHPLLLGTVFSTTSLGLILPLSKEFSYKKEFSHILLASVFLVDIASMFILAFSLSFITGSLSPSFIYSFIMIAILFIIPWLINKGGIKNRIVRITSRKSRFSVMIRASFALIVVFSAVSDKLGFHSIIGAFIAGLIISEVTEKASLLEKQLESFGYGFFIPFFFIIVGSKINIPSIFSDLKNIKYLVSIIAIGILAKVIGVGFITRLKGFKIRECFSFGLFHSARLSMIIAVSEIGFELKLINENIFSSLMLLAIISAIAGPSLGKLLLGEKARLLK